MDFIANAVFILLFDRHHAHPRPEPQPSHIEMVVVTPKVTSASVVTP